MIEVKNLVKKYGSLEVLKGIDFEIEKGSVFGFLGSNGAGKTTTMNILTGLIDYQKGQISFDGQQFDKNKRELRLKIGYLTENPVFYDYMNSYQYLQMIGELSKYPQKEISERIEELLDLVGLDEKAAKRKIGGYSRGMRQRLGLAVALFNHPEYLFLDEPTSALDPEGRKDMLNLLEELKKLDITVFLSTHILADVEKVCDKVSILDEGRIKLTRKMEELREEFIQPIFDIELEGDGEQFKERLSKEDWVEQIEEDDYQISVYVSDLSVGKENLPAIIGELGLSLKKYQIRQSTLEDIFIRMVNKK